MIRNRTWTVPVILFSLSLFAASAYAQQASARSAWPYGGLIAEANLRIDPNGLAVRVLVSGRPVHLAQPVALFVLTPLGKQGQKLATLDRKRVAVIPSDHRPITWKVYESAQLPLMGPMSVDNIFLVKQVLVSSRPHPVRVILDGRKINLKAGQALVVV